MARLAVLVAAMCLAITGTAAAAEYYEGQGYVRVHDSVGAGYDQQNDNVVFGSFFVHLHDFTPGQVIRVKVENRGHHPTAPYAKVAGPWTLTIGADGMARTPLVTLASQEYKVKIQLDYGTPAEVKDYYNFEVRGTGAAMEPPPPSPTPPANPSQKRVPAPSPSVASHRHAVPALPGGTTQPSAAPASVGDPAASGAPRSTVSPPSPTDPPTLGQGDGSASRAAGAVPRASRQTSRSGSPWTTVAGTAAGFVAGAGGAVLLLRRRLRAGSSPD